MHNDILCIIPARAGSKGIPHKNMAQIGDMPLIGHSILHAIEADIPLTNIVVSSNDDAVLDYAKDWCVVPHKRPEEICADNSSTELAMIDVAEAYPGRKTMLLLQPTSPIRYRGRVEECIEKYQSGDYDSLLTTTRLYNFMWMERQDDHGKYKWFSNYSPLCRPTRQSLRREDYLHFDNGNLYLTDISALIQFQCRIGDRVCVYPITEIEGFQLDTLEELEFVEILFQNNAISKLKVKHEIRTS